MKNCKIRKSIAGAMALVLLFGLCLTGCGHTHEWGEWTLASAADCENDGTEERVCECGEVESRTVSASGHDFSDWTITAEADCDSDGAQERECANCGKVENETIASPGHSFTAATLFAPKTCSVCGLTEGDALGTVIAVGDSVEEDDHAFTLEEVFFGTEIKERHGNITYSYGGRGSYNLVLKLAFTNLDTEELDSYNSDRFEEMELVYMDKYEYEGDYHILGDDIVPLSEGYVYVLYAIPESMEDDSDSSIIASFELDGETYVVVVNEGSGSAAGGEEAKAGNTDSELSVGAERSGEEYSFTLEEAEYTDEIKEKHGNITYSYGSKGYYYMLKLDFQNLSTETMQSYNSERFEDMQLVYNGKYKYDGECRILADDIVPLANGYVYIIFPVSETMEEDESGSVVVNFSLDGDDYTLVVNEGDGSGMAEPEKPEVNQDPVLSIGDERAGDDAAFVLNDIYFTDKIKEKHGNVSYSFSGTGLYMLVLELEVTNYSEDTLGNDDDKRIDDIELEYDGKSDLDGQYHILADDIVPFANGNVYIYFAVDEAIEDDGKSLVATFEFDGAEYTVDCRQ